MNIQSYFKEIESKVRVCYSIAENARRKGLDPKSVVEVPIARSLAERVVGLISMIYPQISDPKIVKRIFELEKEFGILDHTVALKIAEEIAKENFCKFKSHEEAIDAGIRVGFAYITVGVVASPLEGFTHFSIKKTREGKDYLCAYYSGPVRSAGGTAASFSVLIVDHLREVLGYARYDPTEKEIKRTIIEVFDYHDRITNLQYVPSEKEIEFLAEHLPVQINGLLSENKEVSNYKDLPRIETNFIRNGVALVLAEGFAQKAHKILRILKNVRKKGIKLSDWDWLEEFVDLKNKEQEKLKKEVSSATYISDIVAGRPVLGHPSKDGGFRLRYGKCRTSGLSSMAMHPLTMEFLRGYIAVGTQLKYEGPGKSSAMSICDDIEGPIVKLNNGSVVRIDSWEKAEKYKSEFVEVLFLGDFLVNYAEYFNRAKHLQKPGYCEEWYSVELEKRSKEKSFGGLDGNLKLLAEKIIKNWRTEISIDEAVKLSETLGIAFYPKYIFYWNQLTKDFFLALLDWLSHSQIRDKKLILPYNKTGQERFSKGKRALELLGAEHEVATEDVVLSEKEGRALLLNLGLKGKELGEEVEEISKKISGEEVLEIVNKFCKYKIKDKTGTFIGARMGRPEKAKLRKLTGSPHALFPVGEEGGRMRSVQEAISAGSVKADFPTYYCKNCQQESVYPVCESCGEKIEKLHYCPECQQKFPMEKCPQHNFGQEYNNRRIDIKYFFDSAIKKLGLERKDIPILIKGVRGTSSIDHTPENLAKGILRARFSLNVNKDGTIRYDLTEMPLTHFKAKEIGTSIEKLKELGYGKDIKGRELANDEQLIELLPQDVILPACPESKDEKADEVFLNISKYIDELLVRFYGQKPFYGLKNKEDLIGHLVLGLAPHTSAGIVGRIIGFSKTQAGIAHPMWHAAMRRDCEGDETCIILLLDVFLNFSRAFLPGHRGSTQDAPLVATSILVPTEIDDMAFDIDVLWKYPLELYEAAEQGKDPRDIKITQLADRLGTEKAYTDFGFTHTIEDLNNAVRCSAYKSIPTMQEKVEGQMLIAEKLRSVKTADAARLVIDKHFMRDIKGNLRKFSQQQFRCVKCNEKYRRPPLIGKCLKCQGRIIFTVSEGGIIKYLEPALSLAENYNVPEYVKQNLELTKKYIESIFGKETEKQEALGKWFEIKKAS